MALNETVLKLILKLSVLIIAIFCQQQLNGTELINTLSSQSIFSPQVLLLGLLVIYVFLLAVPYFPGIEIGLAIMFFFGLQGVITVYLATSLGLFLSYIYGRTVSLKKSTTKSQRIFKNLVQSKITGKLSQKSPLIILIVLLNLPGNLIFGGGGGIALNYGYANTLSPLKFILASLIATAPVPMVIAYQLSYSL